MKKRFTLFLTIITLMTTSLRAQSDLDMNSLLSQINADSLLQTVMDLQNFGSRFALREGGNIEVAEYLVERLHRYDVSAVIDSFHHDGYFWLGGYYDQWFYNVKGILPSANPVDDSIVIVGAHLDAISYDHSNYSLQALAPGADDNASGVAVMIELARICHANHLQFHRDIHFMAYDGEELGLFGSYYDAEARLIAEENVKLMINNDMVSFQPDNDWRLTLHWYSNAMEPLHRAAELCAQYTDIEPYIPDVADNTDAAYSDSYAYYVKGFPAVFAIEYTFSTSYHTDHDVADSNNYAYHADVARYNMALLADYALWSNGTGVEEHETTTSLCLSPNPVNDRAVLLYQNEEGAIASISVYDMTGRLVLRQDEQGDVSGTHRTELNLSHLPSGFYICRLQTPSRVETVKFVRE